jgi:hypothetical protein
MLVQRRDVPDAGTAFGPLVKIKVSFGLISHDITAPAFASFGDVKKLLVSVTGLTPKEQRLLFKGIEKEDSEALHMAGVKDKAKLILMEDPAARERKVQEQYKQEQISRSYQIVTSIQAEVDKLAEQVSTSEGSFNSGDGISVSELRRLNEDLMQKLLRLDGVEAMGEVMILRKTEVPQHICSLLLHFFTVCSKSKNKEGTGNPLFSLPPAFPLPINIIDFQCEFENLMVFGVHVSRSLQPFVA